MRANGHQPQSVRMRDLDMMPRVPAPGRRRPLRGFEVYGPMLGCPCTPHDTALGQALPAPRWDHFVDTPVRLAGRAAPPCSARSREVRASSTAAGGADQLREQQLVLT